MTEKALKLASDELANNAAVGVEKAANDEGWKWKFKGILLGCQL
jgi:hypothetical protein